MKGQTCEWVEKPIQTTLASADYWQVPPPHAEKRTMRNRTPLKREDGAGIIEYALVVGLIAITSVSTISLIGGSTSETFTEASAEISHAGNVPSDESTTTGAGDATSTTVASGSDESDDSEGPGAPGGPATTTTTSAPAITTTSAPATTTTTAAPVTTTTAPSYPTASTGIDGEFSVVFGYEGGKVIIVSTDPGTNWSYGVKSQKKNSITIEWTNKKTGEEYQTTGLYKKGTLETEIDS
jgi:Flp pilus assembly pilin Flp